MRGETFACRRDPFAPVVPHTALPPWACGLVSKAKSIVRTKTSWPVSDGLIGHDDTALNFSSAVRKLSGKGR